MWLHLSMAVLEGICLSAKRASPFNFKTIISSARRGLLCKFSETLTQHQTKFSRILHPYAGLNNKNPYWVIFTVQPKQSLRSLVLGYLFNTLPTAAKKNNKQQSRDKCELLSIMKHILIQRTFKPVISYTMSLCS